MNIAETKDWIKQNKRTAIIAGVVIAIILIASTVASVLLIRRKMHLKNDGTFDNNFDIGDFEDAMKVVKANYPQWADTVEQVYRLESGNFTSTQYAQCGTAGMLSAGSWPFYGWSKTFFTLHPSYAPLGTVDDTAMKTLDPNWTGGSKIFVVLPSVEAGAMFLAYWLNAGNALASWGGGAGYVASVQQQSTAIADAT